MPGGEVRGQLHALDLVAQHPDLADGLRGGRELGAVGFRSCGGAEAGAAGHQGGGVEVAGALAAEHGTRLQPGGERLAGLVGPAEAEAVALPLEARAPHRGERPGGAAVGAVEQGALRDDTVDLRLHLRRDGAATDGAGRAGGLRAGHDRALLGVAVGQERHGAQGEREGGGGDAGGVAPQRAARVVRGDPVGERAGGGPGQEAGEGRGKTHGEGTSIR